jgi:hypothetical protein
MSDGTSGQDDTPEVPPGAPVFLPPAAAYEAPTGTLAESGPEPTAAAPPDRPALGGGSGGAADHPRPVPSLSAMVGVGGGLLMVAGLFSGLAELDSYDQRWIGLLVSLLFTVLGVVITVINRSSRSAAAGVALSAIGVIPLTLFLWINADIFKDFAGETPDIDPFDGLRGTITLILLTAAGLWLIAYFAGPGRRYGFYLGAALIALWLIPMNQIAISAAGDAFQQVSSSFGSVDPGISVDDDGTFVPDDDFGTFDEDGNLVPDDQFGTFDEDGNFVPSDEFDEDPFDQSFEEEPAPFEAPDVDDPTTRLGVTSLLFGGAYLAMALVRDRRGDAKMATAFVAVAIPILTIGFQLLAANLATVAWCALLFAIGAAVVTIGVRGGRRFSSWFGVAAATIAVIVLVADTIDGSPVAAGAVLTVLGLVLALGVGRWDERSRGPVSTDPASPSSPPPAPDAPPPAATVPSPPAPPGQQGSF